MVLKILQILLLLIVLICFYLIIRTRVFIKELHKIGILTILLISLYIALYSYMCINKNVYVSLMSVLLCLIIIYRLTNLTINYSFSKNNKTFYYFHQKDRRWNKLKYGKSTIGKAGCGVAVLSMIHSAFDKEANPISTAKWITDNFQINVGTPMDIMVKYFDYIGVDNGFLSREENFENSINNNIICVLIQNKFYYLDKLFGSTGLHSVILYEISESKAYIVDPDNFSNSRKAIKLKSFKKRVDALPKNITHPYIYVRF